MGLGYFLRDILFKIKTQVSLDVIFLASYEHLKKGVFNGKADNPLSVVL